jgi:3'(2'), 5'-bisphosphate nucleotidase
LSTQTHEWDACGPEAILRAAGGTVTDLDGLPLRYNKELTPTPRGIVASNGPLHGGCLEAVKVIEAQRRRALRPG